MEWKYKSLIFLILLLFCMSSVCAAEHNTTDNVTTLNQKDNHSNITTGNVTNDTTGKVTNDTTGKVTNDTTGNVTKDSTGNVSEIEQLKEENKALKEQIKKTTVENKRLKKILHRLESDIKAFNRYMDEVNKCITKVIKDVRKSVLHFKAKKGRLPNYVDLNGVRIYKRVYLMLFDLVLFGI